MKPGSLTRRPKDPLLSPSQGNLVNKIYLQLHVMDCGSYIGVKLLEHSMKIIGFVPGKGTTDALFLVRRLQEEH